MQEVWCRSVNERINPNTRDAKYVVVHTYTQAAVGLDNFNISPNAVDRDLLLLKSISFIFIIFGCR